MFVSRRRFERAMHRARARETALVGVAVELARAARDSVEAVREQIARAVRESAPAVDGVLFYEEHDGALCCVAAFGERFAYFVGASVARDDASSLIARAVAVGHRVTLEDAGVRALHPGDVAAVAVPLTFDSPKRCAVVAVARVHLGDDVDRFVMLAELAAPAYAIALDREHDRRRAEYDGLTGLLTPRALRQRLAVLVERARLVPTARLALLFVDTDHFKQYNDRYGHAAGDSLLRDIAHVLRAAACSADDLVARNGGDEFCVVFTETDKSTAIERAEMLRRRIAELDVARPDSESCESLRISASIGVAAFPPDAATASELLECADEAMYHSKRTGRDGVAYRDACGTFTRLPS
jgi:diguanylate cyclase (GGDEF)-like protein